MTVSLILLLCGFTCILQTNAASSGDVTLCDPTSELFGCSRFRDISKRTDPAFCVDGKTQIMTWTLKGGLTEMYTLRTSSGADPTQDSTTYVPGTIMKLHFSVRHPDWKYRGLLINAVNSEDEVVGSWDFPGTDQQLFWSPTGRGPMCDASLLHTNADEKPYNVELNFVTPAQGTGNISLRTLVKTDVANTGEFYVVHPLVLHEITLPILQRKAGLVPFWTLAGDGENCDTACGNNNGTCDADAIAGVESSPTLFTDAVATFYACPKPLFHSCSQVAPAVETSSQSCMVRDGSCVMLHNDTCENPVQAECTASLKGFQRLCACRAIQYPTAAPTTPPTSSTPTTSPSVSPSLSPTKSPSTSPPTASTSSPTASTIAATTTQKAVVATTSAKRHQRQQRSDDATTDADTEINTRSSSSAKVSFSNVLVSMLTLASLHVSGVGGATPTSTTTTTTSVIAITLSTLMMSTPVTSHNWLFSTGRARQEASTTAPCRARTGADTHAQVGPGQTFPLRWATGHDRDSYWVIVHGDDYHWLSHKDFKWFVNDYIANAPSDSDTAREPKFQRLHGVEPRLKNQFAQYLPTIPGVYGDPIDPNSDLYLNSTFDTLAYDLHSYTDEILADDRRISYKSEKYPWIESAYRYNIVSANRAVDFDTVRVGLPARKGPGHYVVHWWWNGYYDCVDVNVHDTPIPPAEIEGVDKGIYRYQQIDHCQYVDPDYVFGECRDATKGAEACREDVMQWGEKRTMPLGINVVPAFSPKATQLFANNTANIPWNNSTCASGDWQVLHGKTTTNSVGNTYGGAVISNSCVAFSSNRQPTLEEAVKFCSHTPACLGVSWNSTDMTVGDEYTGNKANMFYTCYRWDNRKVANFSAFAKPDNTMPEKLGEVITVSFQPVGVDVPLPQGYKADVGQVRTDQNQYGWRCPMRSRGPRAPDGLIAMDDTFKAIYSGPSTVNLTSFNMYQTKECPDDGMNNDWEHKVPNGAYEVSVGFNFQGNNGQARVAGCQFENVQITRRGSFFTATRVTRKVQVNDGSLSFSGKFYRGDKRIPINHDGYCNMANEIRFQRIADTLNPVWYPGSQPTGAWWQKEFDDREPVGVVTIKTAAAPSCQLNWFFKGNDCENGEMPYAPFNDADEGAIISVADEPCTDAAGCPGGHVCQRVYIPNFRLNKLPFSDAHQPMTPFSVECNGAVGKYIRIHLPGKNRIFSADVTVARTTPKALAPDTKVCYALAAREKKSTAPEFIISTDPEDPIFYSTCFERRRVIEFKPLPDKAPLPKPRWSFNGQCLKCENYEKNLIPANTSGDMLAPVWEFTRDCENCSAIAIAAIAAEVANRTNTTIDVDPVEFECVDTTTSTTFTTTSRTTTSRTTSLSSTTSIANGNTYNGNDGNGNDGNGNNGNNTTASESDGGGVAVTASVSVVVVLLLLGAIVGFVLYRRKYSGRAYNYGKHKNRSTALDNPMYDNPLRHNAGDVDDADAAEVDGNGVGLRANKPMPKRVPPPPSSSATTPKPMRPPPSTQKPLKPSQPTQVHRRAPPPPNPPAPINDALVESKSPPPRPPQPTLVLRGADEEEEELPTFVTTWEGVIDASTGDVYYVNDSGDTRWDSPFGEEWRGVIDAQSGDVYYVHSSGKTSWDAPPVSDSSSA
eukprot:m.82506 g.82506  ORF g.82506 m.82506 type:complete len:1642 (+) comp25523_c0_seq1:122-5047(+)